MSCSGDNNPHALLWLSHVLARVVFCSVRSLEIVSIVVPQRYDSPASLSATVLWVAPCSVFVLIFNNNHVLSPISLFLHRKQFPQSIITKLYQKLPSGGSSGLTPLPIIMLPSSNTIKTYPEITHGNRMLNVSIFF